MKKFMDALEKRDEEIGKIAGLFYIKQHQKRVEKLEYILKIKEATDLSMAFSSYRINTLERTWKL